MAAPTDATLFGKCQKLWKSCNKKAKNTRRCRRVITLISSPLPTRNPPIVRPVEPFREPTVLTPTFKKVVVRFTKVVKKINVRIEKINIKIVNLEKKVENTTDIDEKVVIRRTIRRFKRVVRKLVIKRNTIERTIIAIRFPVRPARVTPVQKDIIKVFKKTVNVNIKKIDVYRKTIVELTKKLDTVSVDEKVVINKKIVDIKKKIVVIIKRIYKLKSTIHNVRVPKVKDVKITRKLSKSETKIVRIFKKKITKIVRRVRVIKRRIVRLTRELKSTDVTNERKVIINKKIVKYTKIVKKLTVEIRHFKKSVNRIVYSAPSFTKPLRPVGKDENVTINIFKKKVNVLVKKVVIIRKRIQVLKKKLVTVDETKKDVINKKIEKNTIIFKKLVKEITHIKRTIRVLIAPVPKPITQKDIQILIRKSKNINKKIVEFKKREVTIVREVKKFKKIVNIIRKKKVVVNKKITRISRRINNFTKLVKIIGKPRLTCKKSEEAVKAFETKWAECKKLKTQKKTDELNVCVEQATLLAASDYSCIHPKEVQDKVVEYKKIVKETFKKITVVVRKLTVVRKTLKTLRVELTKVTNVDEKKVIVNKIKVVNVEIKKLVTVIRKYRKVVKVNITKITKINSTITESVKPIQTCVKTPEEIAAVKQCTVQVETCETECKSINDKFKDFKTQAGEVEATCNKNPTDTEAKDKLAAVQGKCDLLFTQGSECTTKCNTIAKKCSSLETPDRNCLRPKPVQEKLIKFTSVINKLTVTVNKLITKRVIIQRTIRRIERQIIRVPEQKEELIKKVEKYTSILKTLTVKINKIRVTIVNVRKEINVIKKTNVSIYTNEQKVEIKKIRVVIRKKLVIIKKYVNHIRKIRRQIRKITVIINKTTDITKKDEYVKKVTVLKQKIVIITKKIKTVRVFVREQRKVIRKIRYTRKMLLTPVFSCKHTDADKKAIKTLVDSLKELNKKCKNVTKFSVARECDKAFNLVRSQLKSYKRPNLVCTKPAPIQKDYENTRVVIINNVTKVIELVREITKIDVKINKYTEIIKKDTTKTVEYTKKIRVLRSKIVNIRKEITVVRKTININVVKIRKIDVVNKNIVVVKENTKRVDFVKRVVRRLTRKSIVLRKKIVRINKRIERISTKIHKRTIDIRRIHKKLVVANSIVSVSKIIGRPVGPGPKSFHYTHKMFRCTVWKQPQVVGPIAGPGLSKAMNLEILISKEQQYLQVLKTQTAALQATIQKHQNALKAEQN